MPPIHHLQLELIDIFFKLDRAKPARSYVTKPERVLQR